MRKLIFRLLREALQSSKYRKWSRENHELANKSWATQSHLYDRYFLPIDSQDELEKLKVSLYPKLDINGKRAFITFYLYKQDVLNGVLEEGRLR